MSTLIFEDINQAQADGLVAGDVLHFRDTASRAVGVVLNDVSINGTTRVLLSVGGKTLSFNAEALDFGTAITFASNGGTDNLLTFQTNIEDVLDIYSTRPRAIWMLDGSDIITLGGPGAVTVRAGADADKVEIEDGSFNTPSATGDYLIDGGDGDDLLDLHNANSHLLAYGGTGSDRIIGGRAAEHLYGNALTTVAGTVDGDDEISGGDGNDYIQGNAGADQLFGGEGGDRIYGGADADMMSGEAGQDYLQGNKGNDTLDGGDGSDAVRGGADNDLINGGAGDDAVMGDAGDDTVQGGGGLDLLFGGIGNDIFRINAGEASFSASGPRANETMAIADFAHGQDRILLNFSAQAVLIDTQATFGDIEGARSFATQLMQNRGGDREVVALGIGSDTLLFWSSNGSDNADSAVRLLNVGPGSMNLSDFA